MAAEFAAHAALITCPDHPDEKLDSYCTVCDIRVCEGCRGDHKDHIWMRVNKLARFVRQNAKTRCQNITQMKRDLKKNEEAEQNQIEVIRRIQRERVAMVNDYAETLISEVKQRGVYTNISAEFKKLDLMHDFFQNQLDTADDNVIMEMEEEFHIKKKKISLPIQEVRFIEGTTASDVFRQMFGKVIQKKTSYKGQKSNVKVQEISTFTYIDRSNFVFSISLMSKTEARINRFYEEKLDTVDYTGRVTKKMNLQSGTTVDNIIILENNDIIYTLFSDKIIGRLSPSGTERNICFTHPLHPTGICKRQDGHILVCLAECLCKNMTSTSRGEVHLMNTSGRIMHIYHHTGEKKDFMFKHPQRIAENLNTDLCVVDFLDEKWKSRLVVVSSTSSIRFIYNGQRNMKEAFYSNDVCCDKIGRILVTDLLNHAIHLLREDGHFLQYVLTEQSPIFKPTCIGLYDDALWMGCEEGVVRVYKYKDEDFNLVRFYPQMTYP